MKTEYYQNKMKTIFISGKITGEPDWVSLFKEKVDRLRLTGDIYITPIEIKRFVDNKFNLNGRIPFYKDYLIECLLNISRCDAIYFLSNWETSKGCQVEHRFAKAIGIEIQFLD